MFAKELVKFPIKEYLNTVIKKFNFINIDTESCHRYVRRITDLDNVFNLINKKFVSKFTLMETIWA